MKKLSLAIIAISIFSIGAMSFAQEEETTTTTTTTVVKKTKKAKKNAAKDAAAPAENTAAPKDEYTAPVPVDQRTEKRAKSISTQETSGGSQFFWQAGAGQKYLTPSIAYSDLETQRANSNGSTKQTGPIFSLEYQYGLNDMFSIAVSESYADLEQKISNSSTNVDTKGLGDLSLSLIGTAPVSSGNIKFGTGLSDSLGDKTFDSNGNTNYYSGRAILTPYLGYEAVLGNLFAGIRVSYQLGLNDATWKTSSTSIKVSGGDIFETEVFLEGSHSAGKVGGSITYLTISDYERKDTGSKAENPTEYLFKIYDTYDVSTSTTLIGTLQYGKGQSTNSIDSATIWLAQVAARFAF